MKCISVPTSKEAMKRLDYDSCVAGDLIEMEIKEKEFNELWETGLFSNLNLELSILIDEYEDEIIENSDLKLAKIVLFEFIEKYPDLLVLLNILGLIEFAEFKKTSVFMYF